MKIINSDLKKYLKKYPISNNFSFDITPYISLVSFQPDEYILKDDSIVTTLYFLVEGSVKYTLLQPNGKVLINMIDAPGIIGEMELLNAQEKSDEVRACSNCICFSIALRYCRDMILADPKFLRFLCAYLSRASVSNLVNYAQNQTYPLENRMAKFILQTAIENVYNQKHTQASAYLGVSYRHLLYVLAGFCKNGILKKEGRNYIIADYNALMELSREIL